MIENLDNFSKKSRNKYFEFTLEIFPESHNFFVLKMSNFIIIEKIKNIEIYFVLALLLTSLLAQLI